MGVAKARKTGYKARMLFTLFFFMSKTKSHIRNLKTLLLQ